MIEAATPSPKPTPEALRPETTPSFLDQMGTSVRQFATDITKANDDAREQLGRSAVGHMLSGAAPFAVGMTTRFIFDHVITGLTHTDPEVTIAVKTQDRLVDREKITLTETSRTTRPRMSEVERFLPGLTEAAVNKFKEEHPILYQTGENIGSSVLYNLLIARPSQGALPQVTPTDVGAAIVGDVVAEKMIAQKKGYPAWKESLGKKQKGLVAGLDRLAGKNVGRVVNQATGILSYSNGPTVLGLRMMGEGVVALAKNYHAIQHARSHPNEPKPYRPPERKPWEQRNRGFGRDKMYYGQGGGRNDRYHR